MKHCVECLILFLKQNDFTSRIKGAKVSSFLSDFQTLINYLFSCFLYELLMSLRITNYRPNQTSDFDQSQPARILINWRSDLRWKRLFLPVAAISSPPISINLPPSQPYFYNHSPPQHFYVFLFFFFISYCSTTILYSHLHYQSVALHRPLSADPPTVPNFRVFKE